MYYFEPVTLEGKHIRLEPLDPSVHAAPMYEFFEPRVTEFLSRGGSPVETATDLQAHLELLNAIPKDLSQNNFPISIKPRTYNWSQGGHGGPPLPDVFL